MKLKETNDQFEEEIFKLYQGVFMYGFFCCDYAATASVHAALPHKNPFSIYQKTKIEQRCILIQLQSMFEINYIVKAVIAHAACM